MDMDTMRALVAEGNIDGLVTHAQQLELTTKIADPEAQVALYSALLAGHLIQDDLNAARFLWKRVPADIKTSDELSALWSIGQALWKHEPVNNLLGAYPWSPLTQSLVLELAEQLKRRAMALLAKAYTTVSLDTVAHHTGLAAEDAIREAKDHGWTFDEATKIFTIPRRDTVPAGDRSRTTAADQLAHLSNMISQLDYVKAAQ